jgi:uridine kinase
MVYILGIAGCSASGKTKLCKYLAKELEAVGITVSIIAQDWYYKSLPDGTDGDTYNWDDPSAMDHSALAKTLESLGKGEPAFAPDHDYTNYKSIPNSRPIPQAMVYLVEGIFVLHATELSKYLDCKVFVDCDEDVALIRRALRDAEERHYGIQVIADRYRVFVKPAYKKYIRPSKSRADIILMNNENKGFEYTQGVEMLKNHISAKTKKIDLAVCRFLTVPTDVLKSIFEYVDLPSKIMCKLTCRRLWLFIKTTNNTARSYNLAWIAALYGHLNIVKYAYSSGSNLIRIEFAAIKNDTTEILDWLYSIRNEIDNNILMAAITSMTDGKYNPAILNWLYDHSSVGRMDDMYDYCITSKSYDINTIKHNLDLVKWIYSKHGKYPTDFICNILMTGQIDVLESMYDNGVRFNTPNIIDYINHSVHYTNTLVWLRNKNLLALDVVERLNKYEVTQNFDDLFDSAEDDGDSGDDDLQVG